MRVLRPGGKYLAGDKILVKPVPRGTDDWTHPYHGPDNNPLSNDQLARAPYATQFLAKPWYCPIPEVTVISGGRVFKAFGHIASKPREYKWMNTLIAMNAYNGTILWKRKLQPGFMIHRSTMIATPETLFLADNDSCKLIDAATGKLKGEIVPPRDKVDGPSWKWMALENGVLYALLGESERRAPDVHANKQSKGWAWSKLGQSFRARGEKYPLGFGRTILAIDPPTKKVLWYHREDKLLDSRALCMKNGRIYFYSHHNFLAALRAKDGEVLWRTSDPELLEAIGTHHPAQQPSTGWASSAYVKCSDDALFFAGPTRGKLLAVSAKDGKKLWEHPNGNVQLVLRDDGVYAFDQTRYGRGRKSGSLKFDPLTGKVLARFKFSRSFCTRATGNADSLFIRRGGGSTTRYDVPTGKRSSVDVVRPGCTDGVITANGLVYWGPWLCDCASVMRGMLALAPSPKRKGEMKATEAERLETFGARAREAAPFAATSSDWPTYHSDNVRSAATSAALPTKRPDVLWKKEMSAVPAAPVAVGGLIFAAARNGIVRAIDAESGEVRWTAYTGGPIYFPPSIWKGRAYVGSGDGWVYAFEATSGRPLWRFRAAPIERKIPVYGSLSSTWPVAGGVLVQDGVVYAAAGIVGHDGAHVYALDAVGGGIRWRKSTASLNVQGNPLLHDGRLYIPGSGNPRALQTFDIATGESQARRQGIPFHGRELILAGGKVTASLPKLYAPNKNYRERRGVALRAAGGGVIIMQSRNQTGAREIMRLTEDVELVSPYGPRNLPRPATLWSTKVFDENTGIALGSNAVLVMGENQNPRKPDAPSTFGLAALKIESGEALWKVDLPARPIYWGLAIDRSGRIVVALEDGRILCLGEKPGLAGRI